MGELGQQTVDFSSLVKAVVDESFLALKELVDKARSNGGGNDDQSDSEKKIGLLKYLNKTRQRMLRLNVLAKWCQQVPLIQYCQQLQSTLSSHDTCFTQAADSMFFMHEGLQQARGPIYDVPSAVEILLTGSYQRLPKCIEDIGAGSTLTEDNQKPALKKLDILVRSKLLDVSVPKEISEVKILDGTALIRVNGEFKVLVTLGYRGHLSLWRILHLELLVGERSGRAKLEENQRHVLGDDLERRMAAADNPFVTLYSILHELCVALVMDTLIRQVQSLRVGRWKDSIRFELISEGSNGPLQLNQDGENDSSGQRIPGVKIIYWLDLEKSAESSSSPFLKIEPGSDLKVFCSHSTFLIDPGTGKEAQFTFDQSCIDVEKLLLRAICCHRYTRLLEIQKELEKNVQISQAMGDVLLHYAAEMSENGCQKNVKSNVREREGAEVLKIRAYGSSFFTLGINIRNGRFLLQMSENILSRSELSDCEDALNQGATNAADVFVNLRTKSILHLFASIGKFLGLEVYESGYAASKVPRTLFNGSAMLLMGFPVCGSSYYLLLQLEKDFKPLFRLLETQPVPTGKVDATNDVSDVVRFKKIDINQMQLLKDELNLHLTGRSKSLGDNFVTGGSIPISELDVVSELNLENSGKSRKSPQSSFSSVVDEVFQLEKGMSSSLYNIHNSSAPTNLLSDKTARLFSTWEGMGQISQWWSAREPDSNLLCDSRVYRRNNSKSSVQSGSFSSFSYDLDSDGIVKRITASKSDQDLASATSPNLGEVSSYPSMDDDQLGLANDSRDIMNWSQILSPDHCPSQILRGNDEINDFKRSAVGAFVETRKVTESISLPTTPVSNSMVDNSGDARPGADIAKQEKNSRKRNISDILNLIPTLHDIDTRIESPKRSCNLQSKQMLNNGLSSVQLEHDRKNYTYGDLVAEANKGYMPSSIYVSALLNVVRHCSLCIKHARLTSQMEANGIPYVEEVGLRSTSSNIWFRLPFVKFDSWHHICLRLGKAGSMYWDVKINDQHFRDLWELQKGSRNTNWGSGVRIANTSDVDSHIRYDPDGVVLSYMSVETDSMRKLVADIRRLCNARMFAEGMRKLLGVRHEEKSDDGTMISDKVQSCVKVDNEISDKLLEQLRRTFKIEAVGLTSFWFSFCSGVLARFVVEWEYDREGCTLHVSPDQLWPHTKFLEEFINGGEVESLLDCIRLTAGPLHSLVAATRPARVGPTPGLPVAASAVSSSKQIGYSQSHNPLANNPVTVAQVTTGSAGNGNFSPVNSGLLGSHIIQNSTILAANRVGQGIVPNSLLPNDVAVVLRGPYWIRIIYRKQFAVDMRCFAGDQVWLQPATPPKGGPAVGGSLPCPQFRPFIMEHVAQELNGSDPSFFGQQMIGIANATNLGPASQLTSTNGNRSNLSASATSNRGPTQVAGLNRVASSVPGSSSSVSSGLPIRRSPNGGVPAHVKGELNTAIIGLGDDGGYGGGWVPVIALKKVLRGILKYLGVLWLFAQLPDLLKEILGSILKENEGALLNLEQELPALRFYVGGYVFAVSVHRVQLLLQVISVKRFHHQQQQQTSSAAQEELTQSEISEICDYFSRRVASEPYDASRVASFITLLTFPIPVLREFLKLIAWKKGLSQTQGGEISPGQKPRIELCLENHCGVTADDKTEVSSGGRSNIFYDRPNSTVDFSMTLTLDPTHLPHINSAGGAAWLPYCVLVRLRYTFSENSGVALLGMEGSHGGKACWSKDDDWEKCKQLVSRTVEVSGSSTTGDSAQGKLRMLADNVQRCLNTCLQGLVDASLQSSTGALMQ